MARRGDHNRLGFALQLCDFRHPGRLLRSGEAIPESVLRFVAEEIGVGTDALAIYAARPQTRREQLDVLREAFGFCMFAPGHGREMLAWLLPVALATTDAVAVATAFMDELRRRVVAPGRSAVERLAAAALVLAGRRVAAQLTRGLTPEQMLALDALLAPEQDTSMSVLAWARQPPGAPSHKTLRRLVEQSVICVWSASPRPARVACIPRGCVSWRARAVASPPSTCGLYPRSVVSQFEFSASAAAPHFL